jgi:hypothetical protein
MDKFWGGVSSQVTSPSFVTLLAPSFVFWAGGLAAWTRRFGWPDRKDMPQRLTNLDRVPTEAILIGGVVVVVASALLVARLEVPTLRVLEGYWPGWLRPLRRAMIRWHGTHLDRAERRWQQLSAMDVGDLTPEERAERAELDRRLRLAPADPQQRMPTAIGNILRAAESRPREKYGLDTLVCWPRLWLLFPDQVKTELSGARAQLDVAVRILLWSVLFVSWTVWAWWALPLGALGGYLAYRWILATGEVYGELLESTFDLHRFALYQALRWPLPTDPAAERASGEQLTEYLFRGTATTAACFDHAHP